MDRQKCSGPPQGPTNVKSVLYILGDFDPLDATELRWKGIPTNTTSPFPNTPNTV